MNNSIKLPYDLTKKYSRELSDIQYLLTNMEKGNIYGYNGNQCRMDGSLEKNCQKLRNEIISLLSKIQLGSDSIDDQITKAFTEKNTR